MKANGFLIHRLLRKNRMEVFEDDREGATFTPQPFEIVKNPSKKEIVQENTLQSSQKSMSITPKLSPKSLSFAKAKSKK